MFYSDYCRMYDDAKLLRRSDRDALNEFRKSCECLGFKETEEYIQLVMAGVENFYVEEVFRWLKMDYAG